MGGIRHPLRQRVILHRNVPARPTIGIVTLLGSLTAFGALSIDMYLPAMPTIAADFGAGPGSIERTLASFLIGLAAGQMFYGPLSDRIGRRLPLIGGIAIYAAASLACAIAQSADVMVVLRLLQGLGACAALVISRAIVRDLFDTSDSARVFSLIMLVFGLAPILAPLLGSLVLVAASWRAIFLVLTVFSLLVLWVVAFKLGETRSSATEATARGEHPIAALHLLVTNRPLMGYMLAGAFNSACLFTYISASPALLMGKFGLSSTEFAWFFGLNGIGLVGASQINRLLLSRLQPDKILSVACVVAAMLGVGFLVIAFSDIGGLIAIMASLFGIISSFGFIMGNANAGALSVDSLRAGSISALLGASGFAVGAAAMTLASLFANGTALPMAAVMCAALLAAASSYYLLTVRSA